MKILVLAVGTRMPSWVDAATTEYFKRLPASSRVELQAVAAARRTKNRRPDDLRNEEGQRLLARVPENAWLVGLTRAGKPAGSTGLSQLLGRCRDENYTPCLVIGGADGLSPNVLQHCRELWSLSTMTMAHPVVRVMLAEQIYRAWSILENKPYHRGED